MYSQLKGCSTHVKWSQVHVFTDWAVLGMHAPSLYKCKNEIRCRDDTVSKTVDTRSHCKVWLRACNNLPQPPKNRDVGRGLRKIVACSQPYLAVASCIYSFWHSVIPTSYFIFNGVYTCFTHFSLTVSISINRGLPSPSTDGVYLDIYPDIARAHPIYTLMR